MEDSRGEDFSLGESVVGEIGGSEPVVTVARACWAGEADRVGARNGGFGMVPSFFWGGRLESPR